MGISRFLLSVIWILLIMSNLLACTNSQQPPQTQSEPDVVCDLMWEGEIHTWVDSNHNGSWDWNESPLPDVEVYVTEEPLTHNKIEGPYATSGENGRTKLQIWLPGCPDVTFDIYPRIPDGYVLTTPEHVMTNTAHFGIKVLFGFQVE